MRRSLFAAWVSSISDFQYQMGIVADFMADIGHPDEAVFRSHWVPVGNGNGNAKRWWQWAVFPANVGRTWNAVNSRIGGRKLNFLDWACWPSYWVRVSSFYIGNPSWKQRFSLEGRIWNRKPHVCDGYGFTIGLKAHEYCTPIERIHGEHGWTALFHPEASLQSNTDAVLF